VLRKYAVLVAAVLLPGGLIALLCALVFKAIARTEKGRKVVDLARSRVPAWAASWRVPVFGARQAA